ncbi:YrdB family protein [Arthrobacter sp. BF1]|uniref:YrdB family protein n=1 Tax=Arthrobacter sp. BF1 TaxID=2821145 RepID=UPI001C4F8DBC
MENSTAVGTQAGTEPVPAAESQAVEAQAADGKPVAARPDTARPDAAAPLAAAPARRRAAGAADKGPAITAGLGVLGFALEVAMLAAFVFWGFRQESPWDMVLGIGVPAVVVVLWGVFLAPRSERRLKPAVVLYVATALFLLAALALFGAKAMVLGTLMAVFSVGYFAASGYVARQSR